MRSIHYAVLALMVALVLAAACSAGEPGEGTTRSQADPPVVEVPALWATAQADSFESLVAATGTVFVGEVRRSLPERETPTARQQSDGLRPSIPVTSFEVRVATPIIGGQTEGKSVVFDQPYGTVQQPDGPVKVFLEGDVPLEVGASYLFFASARDDGTFTSAPFARFEVTRHGFEALPQFQNVPVAGQLERLNPGEAAAQIRRASE